MSDVPDNAKKLSKIFVLIICVAGLIGLLKSSFLSSNRPIAETADDVVPQKVITEITFWGISGEDNQNEEVLQQLVTKYNTLFDTVHVNLEMKSDRYFYKIFSTAIASQNNPDVSILFCSQAAQFWDKGFLFSLDYAISEITEEEQYHSKILEQTRLYKQNFGIPMSFESYVLLVNKGIFDKEGIELPENLEDFLEALKRLTSRGTTGVALPSKGYLSARTLTYFLLVNGGSLFESTESINLREKKSKEIYEFLEELYDEGLIYDDKTQLSIQEVTDLFSRGEVATVLTSPTKLREIFEDTSKAFIKDVDILTLRGFDDIMYSSGPIFLDVLCVYKNSQHKEEAQHFASWLCKEYARYWQGNGNNIPALCVQNDSSILNERFTQKYFDEILPKVSYPTFPKTNSINYIILEGTDVLNDFFTDIASDMDLDELILEYQEQMDEWVERFNRHKV